MIDRTISAPRRDPVRVGIALILDPPPGIILSPSERLVNDAVGPPTTTRILITKREEHTPYGGYWEFPGGKIEPGESIPDGVARECMEELGIRVVVGDGLPALRHEYEHATVELHAHIAWLGEGSGPIRHLGVAAHRWVGLSELPWMEFLPANVRLVTRLVRWLEAARGRASAVEAGMVRVRDDGSMPGVRCPR